MRQAIKYKVKLNVSFHNSFFNKEILKTVAPMTSAVTIEEGKYGSAIMLLVRLGGSFATKHKRILIVNSDQKRALEQAGFLTANGSRKNSNGTKKKK